MQTNWLLAAVALFPDAHWLRSGMLGSGLGCSSRAPFHFPGAFSLRYDIPGWNGGGMWPCECALRVLLGGCKTQGLLLRCMLSCTTSSSASAQGHIADGMRSGLRPKDSPQKYPRQSTVHRAPHSLAYTRARVLTQTPGPKPSSHVRARRRPRHAPRRARRGGGGRVGVLCRGRLRRRGAPRGHARAAAQGYLRARCVRGSGAGAVRLRAAAAARPPPQGVRAAACAWGCWALHLPRRRRRR